MTHALPHRPGLVDRWVPVAIVWGMFLAHSAVQSPVPGVNEPQYLGKAAHFWNPSWAAGDYFLDSSNPHLVFYIAVGWLTRFTSLETTAWLSRIAGYAVLALGWTLLAGRLSGTRWTAMTAAAVFLLLGTIGNLSGEWIVGGIEGKVVSYGLLFAALAAFLDGRRTLAAACLGGSVSFHPIVGMWGLLCGIAAEFITSKRTEATRPPGWKPFLVPSIAFLATALPGLLAAMASLGGASPEDAARANYMQVFIRLKHHLDPTTFGLARYAAYTVMVGVWLMLAIRLRRRQEIDESGADATPVNDWFRWFVLTTVVVALAGVAIGWHFESAWTMPLRDLRGALLKFYPFRLADVFVPLALSMAMASVTVTAITRNGRRRVFQMVAIVATAGVFIASLMIESPNRNPSRMPPAMHAAWVDVARWVRSETTPGTVIVPPDRLWGFRWYSERALYVNYKDAPQDTPGLLEWERRLALIKTWWEASSDGRYRADDLRRLGEQTGAAWLVTRATPLRFHVAPVYDNGEFRVYGLE